MRSYGFTLLEVLMVLAIIGLLAALSVGSWSAMTRNLEFSGYTRNIATSLQQATSQANTRNRLHLFVFDNTGFRWGQAPDTLSLSTCTTQTTAPTLGSDAVSFDRPVSVTGPSGWLCLAPTGVVSRLNTLGTCSYGSGTAALTGIPCLTYNRGSSRRSVLVSVSGQAFVQ